MVSISFHGAAREVTGSNYLIEGKGQRIVVDCGLFQGNEKRQRPKNLAPLPFQPRTVDSVLQTHAHLDHTGRLPKLFAEGYRGKILATAPTKDLARVVLEDTEQLALSDLDRSGQPLIFSTLALDQTFKSYQTVDYREPIDLGSGVRAIFRDAGHILGSSLIEFLIEDEWVVFSGDYGNPPVPILEPPETIQGCDVLVIESTYGDRFHEPPVKRAEKLRQALIETIEQVGVLLIPTFAIERAQELLYELDHIVETRGPKNIPIFFDSPMAIRATKVFKRYEQFWNREARAEKKRGNDFFDFPRLKLTESTRESKAINDCPPPKVIIAGGGMMQGGRILHHLKKYLPLPSTTILFIGYQAEGTLGRRLFDWSNTEPPAQNFAVSIHDQKIPVRARIKAIGAYSAHADQRGLLDFIEKMRERPRKIFVTHGDSKVMTTFSTILKRRLPKSQIIMPAFHSRHEI